jgi:glycerol kinase
MTETTALGAAYAAGLAVGFWNSMDELKQYWSVDKTWQPKWMTIPARIWPLP